MARTIETRTVCANTLPDVPGVLPTTGFAHVYRQTYASADLGCTLERLYAVLADGSMLRTKWEETHDYVTGRRWRAVSAIGTNAAFIGNYLADDIVAGANRR